MVAVLLLSFVGVSALVIVTPGQDTALVIRNTLRGGRRGGVSRRRRVDGNRLGGRDGAGWAVLVASRACIQALARRRRVSRLSGLALALSRVGGTSRPSSVGAAGRQRPYRQGLLSNLGNPKIAVFFSSLLPQFAQSFAGLLALGVLFAALGLAWLSFYALVVDRAGDFLRRSAVRRVIDAAVGTVLVAFGVRLATER